MCGLTWLTAATRQQKLLRCGPMQLEEGGGHWAERNQPRQRCNAMSEGHKRHMWGPSARSGPQEDAHRVGQHRRTLFVESRDTTGRDWSPGPDNELVCSIFHETSAGGSYYTSLTTWSSPWSSLSTCMRARYALGWLSHGEHGHGASADSSGGGRSRRPSSAGRTEHFSVHARR